MALSPRSRTVSWPVPFKKRGKTGQIGLNFLWRAGNVFVMDNHRAAAWCWAQAVPAATAHGLFHIDRHPDAFEDDLPACLATLPAGGLAIGVQDYLKLAYTPSSGPAGGAPIQAVRWDNYLPLHLALNPGLVAPLLLATHRDGNLPTRAPSREIEPWALLDALESEIDRVSVPWILNIDLDYFFCNAGPRCVRFLDDAYFDQLSAAIARLNRKGKLAVITIALTATSNFTNGWSQAEALAERLCRALGHGFKLP